MRISGAIMILAVTSTCLAKSGGFGGGDGGQGVACKVISNRDGVPYRVELLDLFEARNLYGSLMTPAPYYRDIDRSTEQKIGLVLENQLERLLNTIQNSEIKAKITNIFKSAEGTIVTVLEDGSLPDTNDFGKLKVPLSQVCSIVQLAIHQKQGDKDIVYLDPDLAGYLNDQQIAALVLHETLHSYFRNLDSNEAIRDFVTFTFSDEKFQLQNADKFEELIRTQSSVTYRKVR